MSPDTMYYIAQILRTAMPICAGIGTITSAAGLWQMFHKWGKPGWLSLVPFVRGWIFSKDSSTFMRAVYAISDGIILALTPLFYYIRANGVVQEYQVRGFTFYMDRSMLIITIIWAIAEFVRFLSSVDVSSNLCKKNDQGILWVICWVAFPWLPKILWGLSNRYMKVEEDS